MVNIRSVVTAWRKRIATSITLNRAIASCFVAVLGTSIAFAIIFVFPLVAPDTEILKAYSRHSLPKHSLSMGIGIATALLVAFAFSIRKLWNSMRLGLIPLSAPFWVVCVATSWLALELRRTRLAASVIIAPALLSLAALALRKPRKENSAKSADSSLDLPLAEDGEDLLGLGEAIDSLVTKVVLERPRIVAITGTYGQGKTSFVNLALGKLRKLEDMDRPIIVKFSPWLAADANGLIISLLNSIVNEMKKHYTIPGLQRDAFDYARTLLAVMPKAERFKVFLSEPSQEEQIARLARRISATDRRVLVVLDDLDRLQASELETVFKVLRGSDAFVNVMFLCCFDRKELTNILRSTRPFQDSDAFIEKFFQSFSPLPEIDSAHLSDLFARQMEIISRRHGFVVKDLPKALAEFWNDGGAAYFLNLRRVKIFVGRVDESLGRIGTEVNFLDFLRLELVRDVAYSVYEQIFRNPQYFYDAGLAFEARYTGDFTLDEKRAKDRRKRFYDQILAAVPTERQYVTRILENLFPHFASYRERHGIRWGDAATAEKDRRIFHPRCFRQYFLLRVPTELFSQKDFDAFRSSIESLSEEDVKRKTAERIRSMETEDFRRWHFVHRIEAVFEHLPLPAARGICRGLMENSKLWTSDSFEFFAAVNYVRMVLSKTTNDLERQKFLITLSAESSSTLCALLTLELLQKEASDQLPSDLQPVREALKKKMRDHYFVSDAPSVFDEFSSDKGKIEPIQLLMGWRHLGDDAVQDQQKYLVDLFPGGRPI